MLFVLPAACVHALPSNSANLIGEKDPSPNGVNPRYQMLPIHACANQLTQLVTLLKLGKKTNWPVQQLLWKSSKNRHFRAPP